MATPSAELLQWYLDMGVDEVHQQTTTNYFEIKQSVKNKVLPLSKQATKNIYTLPDAHIAKRGPDKTLQETTRLVENITSIVALKEVITNFRGLSICETATNTVFADGQQNASILFIGEAPGAEEDLQGIPFCGASGQLLDTMLSHIGISRQKNMYITNTVFWRPPGNRKPTPEELAICKPFLEKHIQLHNPKLIVLVGGTAVCSVLGAKQGITKLRGQYLEYTSSMLPDTIPVTAIFHPSYLLRSPGQKRLMWKDLLTLETYIKQHNIA